VDAPQAIPDNPDCFSDSRTDELQVMHMALTFDPGSEDALLGRITVNPEILGGKPTVRGHHLAVEDVLGMLAAGGSPSMILQGYRGLELADIRACLAYARRIVSFSGAAPAIY
jgi:uncharacterized protein (DUF433 family)